MIADLVSFLGDATGQVGIALDILAAQEKRGTHLGLLEHVQNGRGRFTRAVVKRQRDLGGVRGPGDDASPEHLRAGRCHDVPHQQAEARKKQSEKE